MQRVIGLNFSLTNKNREGRSEEEVSKANGCFLSLVPPLALLRKTRSPSLDDFFLASLTAWLLFSPPTPFFSVPPLGNFSTGILV